MIKSACAALFAASLGIHGAAVAKSAQENTWLKLPSLEVGWQFVRTDIPIFNQVEVDESAWTQVDLPHDWSTEGPFDKNVPGNGSGAFLPTGIGWYRKHFTLPVSDSDKSVSVEFDGIMANADVWINGHHLARHPYGYTSFRLDLTGQLNFGDKDNVLAVRVDDSAQPAARWYTGAGINRHVRLIVTGKLHLDPWGEFITTSTGAPATVHVKSLAVNETGTSTAATVRTTIYTPDGSEAGREESTTSLLPGELGSLTVDIPIKNPRLWDIDHPALYRAVSQIVSGTAVIDAISTPFGIRDAHFEAATGFWLNGKNIKIKGVCLHQDAGALGAAPPPILKARQPWETATPYSPRQKVTQPLETMPQLFTNRSLTLGSPK